MRNEAVESMMFDDDKSYAEITETLHMPVFKVEKMAQQAVVSYAET